MAEKTYIYSGPMTGVTLKGKREMILNPGAEVELPDDNSFVKTLVAMKRLTEKPGTGLFVAAKNVKKEEKENAG